MQPGSLVGVGCCRKVPSSPTEEISAVRRGRGDKLVSDNCKCIRTSKGGLTSNFLCGGGMDVFWNDPMKVFIPPEIDSENK